jgi:hypothetical protein
VTIAVAVSVPAVTFPPPAGEAQTPSPRKKVDEFAPVPLLRFVTGRFPVTPPAPEAARLIAEIWDADNESGSDPAAA